MTRRGRRLSRMGTACLLAATLAFAVGGCTRGSTSKRPPIHPNPNMDDQPKIEPFDASPWFPDGSAMRPPVPGTVARGELFADPVLHTGAAADGTWAAVIPIAVDDAVMARGGGALRHLLPALPRRQG